MCRWMALIFTTGLTIMGSHFQRVTRMGSHMFCFFGVKQFFIFTVRCSSFNLKHGQLKKIESDQVENKYLFKSD